ncbi:MAG: hypothetical protein JNK06_18970 [Candidatus Accumulibacter phosphatis]|uniref:hypothetical protein n=1 Tax=Candidatus Accumulibacter phosphatis TaxID=327160 RepID=UPI001A38B1BF|nr:hypothetical protein [Candidatus Accumulibacter phosphatis]
MPKPLSELSVPDGPRWGPPVLLLLAIVVAILPFWVVSVPPSTDLPQHLSQIFLFEETLAGNRPELVVTPWYYPNTLVYGLIYSFWLVADPLVAGRLILSALAAGWLLGSYALARCRRRQIESWLIGVPLVFNFLFYWGLLNFLVGWPVFCLFVVVASRRPGWLQAAGMAGTALLLYYAHALWFLMASVWVIARFVDKQPGSWRLSLASLVPAWVLACIWYPQLAMNRQASGVSTMPEWSTMPLERAKLEYFANAAQGGLQGSLEQMFVIILAAWILLAVVTRWRQLDSEIDRPLFLAALGLLLAYWVLPWNYMNTIFFNQRWLPCALVLLLLALPAPRMARVYGITVGLGLTLIFSLATIKSWRDWDEEQMGGFLASVHQLNKADRVFGVDMDGGSIYVKGRPGLQLSSYAQALRGCDTNFSFTEHYSGIVQYRNPAHVNPTRELVWSPFRSKPDHLVGFNRVLINGDANLHDFVRQRLNLDPIDDSRATWRLYRISGQP